jgi:cyclic pyranopterin phosphate synthase
VLAHEATRYHALTRSDGTFALLERAIGNVLAAGLPLECELIAKSDTYRHLPESARWLAARGVRSVRLWLVSLTDGNAENVASLPRMSEVAPFFRTVFAEAREGGRSAVSLHLPKCTLPGDEAHVVDPAAGGVLCVTPDAEFQLEESQLTGQHKPESCRACREDATCRGVRRDYAERYGTAELIPLV